jgi:hypothetical protein
MCPYFLPPSLTHAHAHMHTRTHVHARTRTHQVVIENLLAGDANSVPLVARLPASLLCRHAAAVGAELVAFRARLRDALASEPDATGAVWTELPDEAEDDPAGAAAVAGEAEFCSASQPGLDDTAAGLGAGEGEVGAAPPPPDEPLGTVAAGEFEATDGGEEDMWLAIEVGCGAHAHILARARARARTRTHARTCARTH